jgi:hypothetical protein
VIWSLLFAAAGGGGASGLDAGTLIPAGAGVTGAGFLIVLLVRELNKSSSGAWTIVREKNRTIHLQNWKIAVLEYRLAKCQNVEAGLDPGPYVPPTEEELKTW